MKHLEVPKVGKVAHKMDDVLTRAPLCVRVVNVVRRPEGEGVWTESRCRSTPVCAVSALLLSCIVMSVWYEFDGSYGKVLEVASVVGFVKVEQMYRHEPCLDQQ